jgi:GNAT superfamily N-acetyltransferase
VTREGAPDGDPAPVNPASGPGKDAASGRVRPASREDAAIIARHRVRLFQSLLPAERHDELEALFGPSRDAVLEALDDGTSLAWVADEPEPSGSLVMHLVRRLPSPSSPTGREGYVVHVFVEDARRDSGLGSALLAAAEAAGRARGLTRIRLHAVDRALAFYRRAGYVPRTNDLERFLR